MTTVKLFGQSSTVMRNLFTTQEKGEKCVKCKNRHESDSCKIQEKNGFIRTPFKPDISTTYQNHILDSKYQIHFSLDPNQPSTETFLFTEN